VDTLSYKTVSANKATVQKNWVLVDAENQVLGRLASKVAKMIRGKYKTSFTPHVTKQKIRDTLDTLGIQVDKDSHHRKSY
jgi:hypothetical protein